MAKKKLTLLEIREILRKRQVEICDYLKEYAKIGIIADETLKEHTTSLEEVRIIWGRLNK